MARRTIQVASELVGFVDEWAKAKGKTKDEAYDRFMQIGIVRHNALAKYAKKGGAPKAGAKKAGKGKGKKAAKAA